MLYFTPNLQVRSKWLNTRDNLCVGYIALRIDPQVSRSKWKMAVVENVYPGKDGLVRSTCVKTALGTYDCYRLLIYRLEHYLVLVIYSYLGR